MSWANLFPEGGQISNKITPFPKIPTHKYKMPKVKMEDLGQMFPKLPKMGKMTKFMKSFGGTMKEAMGAHPALMAAQGLLEVLRQMGILEPALEWIEGIFEIIGAGALEALTPIMERFANILGDPIFQEALQGIGEIIAGVLLPTLEMLIGTLETVVKIVRVVRAVLDGTLTPLQGIITLFYGGSPGLIPAFETLYAVGQPLLAILGFLCKGLFDLGAGLQGFLGQVMEAGQEVLDAVGSGIGAGVESVGGFLAGDINLGQAIEGVANAVVSTLEDVGEAIAGLFGFAGGGIVTRPTVAKLGESGPELITNVEQFREMAGMTGMGGGGGITVNVEGSILNNELVENIIREIEFKKGLGIF